MRTSTNCSLTWGFCAALAATGTLGCSSDEGGVGASDGASGSGGASGTGGTAGATGGPGGAGGNEATGGGGGGTGGTAGSGPTPDLTDGFEYANNQAMVGPWDSSCELSPYGAGVMDVSSTQAHSGSTSLKLTFPSPDSEGGCFMNRYLSAPTDHFYMRVWVFLDNFANKTGVPTKMWQAGKQGSYPNFWGAIPSGGTQWGVAVTNSFGFVGMVSGGTIPLSEWACLEYRVSMNTPGVANGVITAWINDVEVVNRSDLLLRGASDSGNFNTPSSNIALITTYRQHGHGIGEGTTGYIYYDDYAASRAARIGCGALSDL